MAGRRYDQYCGVARALEVVGERWTLLIVRELLLGPRRYTDLAAGLPGMASALLAARLKQLVAEGLVIRRTLPPPAGSRVYELTAAGRELEPLLDGLARWGSRWLGSPRPGDAVRARWVMLAMKTRFDAEAARGVRETYEFRFDRGETFQVTIDDGDVDVRDGQIRRPALVVEGDDVATFLEAARSEAAAARAVASGALAVEGDLTALERCRAIFAPALAMTDAPAGAAVA